MTALTNIGIDLIERSLVPDALTRAAIRRLCDRRLRELAQRDQKHGGDATAAFAAAMIASPVAPLPEAANAQHYEVPAEFFGHVLGPHRKYSCCYFKDDATTLGEAEADALAQTCQRADLRDGQDILELGCGWGSLSLWMAERYAASRITAVSNSASQRRHIESEAARRGLNNLRVITADINGFDPGATFDRVVSVEMFEHTRNWEELFRRVSTWLRPDGRFFMHIFVHRARPYAFETEGASNWMGRYFFTGGMMPSLSLPAAFDRHLSLEDRWTWNGKHYQRTSDLWLANMDERQHAVMPILRETYGEHQAERWFARWRVFFMACSELFGYDGGREWLVGHYRFAPTLGV